MKNKTLDKDSLSDIWKLKKRGKRDSDRHQELVKKAIKKKSKELISKYDVITTDGNKKVKISFKFLDQYKIKYGKINKKDGVGQGLKGGSAGDKYRIKNPSKKGDQAGNEPGDRTFEHEVSIDELTDILIDELELPWMKPKETSVIEIEKEEFSSIEKRGIFANIDLKRTILQNLKRNAAAGDPKISGIANDDLRYRTWETELEYKSNAAVYLMMDRSGSMGSEKSMIAKTFYFWMVQFLRRKYVNVELVFIAHDVSAFVVDQEHFFKIAGGGGTQCSSAFELAYESIKINHPPEEWNNYVFEFSDGDNWQDDNRRCLEFIKKTMPLVTAMGYGEILLERESLRAWADETRRLGGFLDKNVGDNNFISLSVDSVESVFDALKKFFSLNALLNEKAV
jgi:sporulation protein YhbH